MANTVGAATDIADLMPLHALILCAPKLLVTNPGCHLLHIAQRTFPIIQQVCSEGSPARMRAKVHLELHSTAKAIWHCLDILHHLVAMT